MNKTIKLIDIKQKVVNEGKAPFLDVTYKLILDGEPFDLTYKVSEAGATSGLSITKVPNLSDPVVVSLMYNLLVNGYDFESEIPISDKLYHHLTKDFIPHIVAMNKKFAFPITINVPITDSPIEQEKEWVGTGVSCGVDSFSAIKEYSQEKSDHYKLTHLLYFKIGAHHGRLYPCPEETENRIFNEELNIAENFCKQNGYKLVVVDSNVNQMANKFWGATPFGNVAWFRNVGVMLMLQKYFAKYIFATSYATFSDFHMNFTDGLEHNLWWAMPLLGSENLEVVPSSSAMTRVDKTIHISDFKPAHDNLMVCWAGHINCGECDKCIRTLVALDFIGALDRFKKSFNIEAYKANRKRHLQHVVTYQHRDAFFRELCDYAKAHNIKIPNRAISTISEYYRLARKNNIANLPSLVVKRLKAILHL